MSDVQERLDIASLKVDSVIEDIWVKAEDNLRTLENSYKNYSNPYEDNSRQHI